MDENNKELHIWMGDNYLEQVDFNNLYITLEATETALQDNVNRVDTVQTHVCGTTWIIKGYRIFVHMLDGKVIEMKLGHMGDNMQEIRVSQNIENMVLSGCFGKATIE